MVVCTRDDRNELVAAECQVLSGVAPIDGVAMDGRTDLIQRAAYQRFGVSVIAQAADFSTLCHRVATSPQVLNDFHLQVIAANTTGSERRQMLVAVADAIQWGPNLIQPQHRLVLIIHAGTFTLGEINAEPLKDYLQHDSRPHRTSISLPSRMARGLVNLLPLNTRTILDPCCGSGGIPLEGVAAGYEVYCGDLNPRMSHMTRANFRHFGYDFPVQHLDARNWQQQVDAVVTDLPHGRFSHVKEGVVEGILYHAARIARVGVFVAREDLTTLLLASGYAAVDLFRVPKQAGFIRYVHRAWTDAQHPITCR